MPAEAQSRAGGSGGLELTRLFSHVQLTLLWWPWGCTPRAAAPDVSALLGGIRESWWLRFVRAGFSRCSLHVQEDIFWWDVWGFSLLFWRFSSWFIFLWICGWTLGEARVISQWSLMGCPYVHISLVGQSIIVNNISDTDCSCMLGKMTIACVKQESMSLLSLFNLPTSNCLDQG